MPTLTTSPSFYPHVVITNMNYWNLRMKHFQLNPITIDGCLSDSCSSYCPSSASENDSETDDEFLDGTTPSTEKIL